MVARAAGRHWTVIALDGAGDPSRPDRRCDAATAPAQSRLMVGSNLRANSQVKGPRKNNFPLGVEIQRRFARDD
jgi:hypothetical protein